MTHKNRPVTSAATSFVLWAGLALSCAGLSQAAEKVWSQTYTLADGASISLSNINGDVTIRGTNRSDVLVRATITSGSEKGLEMVDIEVSERSRRLEIETDYSKQKGRWNRDGATVEYELEVPSDARLEEIELINGSLEIFNMSGDIETSMVNGNLDAEGLSGSIELETVNGSIDVVFTSVDSAQRIEIESVNGPIDVWLPASADADVEASTVHGRIRNDFGLEVIKGEYVGSDMRGTLGSGGARIEIENVNGSIELRKN